MQVTEAICLLSPGRKPPIALNYLLLAAARESIRVETQLHGAALSSPLLTLHLPCSVSAASHCLISGRILPWDSIKGGWLWASKQTA